MDQQKAAVAGARLELVSADTNVAQIQSSGASGNYVFNFVQPGKYSLKVSAAGFKTALVGDLVVQANKNTPVDVILNVGAVVETIEVKGSTERIDTVGAQVSTNVGTKDIQDLPNFTRNILTYAELAPGVEVDTSAIAGGSQNLNILGTSAQVNGNRDGRNNFYLDGTENSGRYRNHALQMPNPDVVAEVQVSTSNTSAEYGRQAGGMFNVVSKSGTNEFHGTGSYFFRLKELNANEWGRNRLGIPRPDQLQKSGAGTIGGPIIKNKTFFLGSFDVFSDKVSGGWIQQHYAPTKKMLSGDFSEFPQPINDPDTGQPFPGNVIPAGRIDKVGQNLTQLLPTVGNYGDRFTWLYSSPLRNHTSFGKVDHHWNDTNWTSFTWMYSWGSAIYPAIDLAGCNIQAGGPQTNTSHQNMIGARHRWIANPTVVAEFRFGWTTHVAYRDNTAFNHTKDLSDFGAQNVTLTQEGARKYLPGIEIGNGAGGNGLSSAQGWLSRFTQYNHRFGGTLSWAKSSHNLKFGADFSHDAVPQRNDQSTKGGRGAGLTFNGRYSSLNKSTGNFFYGMADLMLGRTTTWGQRGLLDYNVYNWNDYFFVQDEWKVTPRLTFTPGLRYEIYQPQREKNNKMSDFRPGHRSTLFPNAPVGMAFPGDQGVPAGLYNTESSLIAPRLGVAYAVTGDGRTALRGGFGKFYSYSNRVPLMLMAEQNPWRPQAYCSETIVSNPWLACKSPIYTAPPTPFSSKDIQNFNWPPSLGLVTALDPNFKTAYSYQFNVSFAREFWRGVTLAGSYVGNRARNLTVTVPSNWAVWAPGASDGGANINSRRPLLNYGQIDITGSNAKSRYDAFQAVANMRLRRGLTSRFIYVYAHGYSTVATNTDPDGVPVVVNPLDLNYDWGPTQRHHTFKVFYTWDIPFLRNHTGVLGKALGGWQLSGMFRAATGPPMDVTIGRDWNFDGIPRDRPDQAGPIRYVRQSLGNGWIQYLDVGSPMTGTALLLERGAFKLPGDGINSYVFGNLPKNAVFGTGSWGVDSALAKNFYVSERKYFQFRLEGFNISNHPNLNQPGLDYSSRDFGKIYGKSGNRKTQIGLKFYF